MYRESPKPPTVEPPPMHGQGAMVMPAGGWREAATSLQNRDFRVFWLSSVFSFTGMQMGMVVRSWLVYDITDSTTYLGLISAVSAFPLIIFSLPGGVIADRVVKRNLLVLTQIATCILAFALATLVAGNWVQVWHIVLATVLASVAMSLNMPGRQAIVPELVKPDQLMNAIAINSAGANISRIIAPTAAGILVGIIGLSGTYFVYAAAYIFVIATLLMIPATITYRVGRTTMLEDAVESLKYVREHRVLIALLVLAVVPMIFAMPYQMLMPVFARDVLNMGAEGLGMLMGVTGLGAVVGSVFVALIAGSNRKGLFSLLSGIGFGVTLILFGLSSNFYLSSAALILVGASSASFMAINNTLILAIVPDELRGRVMGLYMTTFGLMPLGTLPAGALADVIGAPLTVVLAGFITALVALGGLLFVRSVRRLE